MVKTFLGEGPLRVAFVPFAAVNGDYESYVAKVRNGFSALPHAF
jgi:peptidase E